MSLVGSLTIDGLPPLRWKAGDGWYCRVTIPAWAGSAADDDWPPSDEAQVSFDCPDVLARTPPSDAQVAAFRRLVEWDRPTGLPDPGFRLRVAFATGTDTGNRDPDERMFALWDRFLAGIDRHAAFFRREMVAAYRENRPDFVEQDEFPPDLPDAEVLGLVRGTARLERHEEDGRVDYWLDVSFAARWDGEHAWDFDYDEAADSFGEAVAPNALADGGRRAPPGS